jgi:8-oxo-dGTP pyrophosphatase MutT (NUDIX family)
MAHPSKRKSEHRKFPSREDGIEKLEVHVAGVCVRETKQGQWVILAARRSSKRSLFPEKWECGGGMVRAGEGFEEALKRQMFEEFGLDVEPWFIVESYQIHIPKKQRIIPGVRFVCRTKQGDVKLNDREFSEFKWIKLPLSESLDWIGGIEEIIRTVVTPKLLSDQRSG